MSAPQPDREQEIRTRVDAAVREALEHVARLLVEGGDVLAADEVRKHVTNGSLALEQGGAE